MAAIVALMWQADWRDLVQTLAHAEWSWLAVGVFLALAVELAKTLRWQLILGLEAGRFPRLLAQVLNARMLNALTPFRAGDLWRVVSAARLEHRRIVTVGGSVIAEKALDAAALACLGLAVVGTTGSPLMSAGVVVFAVLAILAVIPGARRWTTRLPWLGRHTAELSQLRFGPALLKACLLTLAGIGIGLLVNVSVLRAFELPMNPTLASSMLLSGYAAGLLPSLPGRVGVFHLAVSTPLMALGLSPASAVAAAVGVHLVLLSSVMLGGLAALTLTVIARRTERVSASS
jgi:uncharacterized membrane protein YbhN (UPF0104 family)